MILRFRTKFAKQDTRGDTVVEVMISMVILALVLGFAYASSTHSLQNSTEISSRNQAVSIAAGQIEYIKNAVAFSPANLANYTKDVPFCILSDGSVDTSSASNPDKVCKYTGTNPFGNFNVGLTYSSATHTFTAVSKWKASDSAGDSQLTLYYKIPGYFLSPTENTQGASPVGLNTATLNGTVSDVNTAGTCYFNYATDAYYTANSSTYQYQVPCADAIPASYDPQPVTAAAPGTNPSLAPGTLYHNQLCAHTVFGDSCGNDSTFTTQYATPTLAFTATPTSIANGGSTTLKWDTTNSPNPCTASSNYGDWSGPKATTGGSNSEIVSGLAGPSTHTYTLSCVEPGGNSGPQTVSISVAAPPGPSCGVGASVRRVGGLVWLSGWGSCPNLVDSAVGPNWTFSDWSPDGYYPNGGHGPSCHTQNGYDAAWVFQASTGYVCG